MPNKQVTNKLSSLSRTRLKSTTDSVAERDDTKPPQFRYLELCNTEDPLPKGNFNRTRWIAKGPNYQVVPKRVRQ